MRSRIDKLRGLFATEDVDGMLIIQPENRYYLSGFNGSAGYLLITAKDAFLITDFRYIEQAAQQAPDFTVLEHGPSAMDKLWELIQQAGLKKVGFEKNYLTVAQYQSWQEKFKGIQLVPLQGPVEKLRQIKDEQELISLRKAITLADEAFAHIIGYLKPGVSEWDVALELEFFMRRRGAEGVSFDFIVASGARGSLPHAQPTDKQLKAGDMVTMDFGAIYKGYCSDITRTVFVGQPDSKQLEVYNIVLEAQKQAEAFIKPGVSGRSVDEVARRVIEEKGFGENFGHGLGHAVGLAVHEEPRLSPRDETLLEPGMVVTIEPGIYIPQWGGVRIEDMVVITPEGCQILTQASKDIIVV